MDIKKVSKLKSYTKKLKLLYVEDNEETRVSTLLVLERFFDEIIVAVDGKDGLDKFSIYSPDAIFTDVNMPNLDGLQMIDKIKSSLNKKVPILVFSAHDESNYLLKAIKIGVDGYLIKPIEVEQLVEELCRIINEKYHYIADSMDINENYSWSKNSKKLYYLAQEVTLTKNEIFLLELMTSNINIIYSDELIIEQVWQDTFNINKSNVKNLLKRLNNKLPEKLIKNIYSVGYSFYLE
ncbi:MAG: transcriptional regulator [Sulfurimonas sp.]|nr:MAG: transcriptional regulator [Sulfurimonas sp.]